MLNKKGWYFLLSFFSQSHCCSVKTRRVCFNHMFVLLSVAAAIHVQYILSDPCFRPQFCYKQLPRHTQMYCKFPVGCHSVWRLHCVVLSCRWRHRNTYTATSVKWKGSNAVQWVAIHYPCVMKKSYLILLFQIYHSSVEGLFNNHSFF